jgi:hypothetical protein
MTDRCEQYLIQFGQCYVLLDHLQPGLGCSFGIRRVRLIPLGVHDFKSVIRNDLNRVINITSSRDINSNHRRVGCVTAIT